MELEKNEVPILRGGRILMGQERVKGYAEGFVRGWEICRAKLCARYKLDIDGIIAWENSDELDDAHEKSKRCTDCMILHSPQNCPTKDANVLKDVAGGEE